MTAAGPWSVKGIDPRAREVAKDLARRSGMTLGEWLNQVITEGEAEEVEYAPPRAAPREIRLSSDAELKRVARALDVLSARVEAAEHRSTLAISGIDQSVMGVLSRIEGVERDRVAVAARFDGEIEEVKAGQSKATERLRRLTDEDAPRLEAMRALESALGKIAEKLYDTDSKTRAVTNEVREDLSNLTRRMDRVEVKAEAEPATALIEQVVAKISERLGEAESRTSVAMTALEASFAGLDARLKANEVVNDENSPERRFERLAVELSDKVEANHTELTERLNAAADGKLDRMEATLRELAGHVEQGERRSAQAIDRMGREVMRVAQTLSDRVASVETRNTEAAQQMGGEMARIADVMEQRMGRTDQVQAEALEKLGGEIARIAERLADRIANAERRSAAQIDDVGEQLGRVTERLNDRYEASQGVLAERIRASEERTAKLLEEARETIDRRLVETQRRHTLEAAADAARRIADDEEGPPPSSNGPSPFSADPFGAFDAPTKPALAEPAAEAFTGFEERYTGFAADGVEAEAFTAPPSISTKPTEPMSTKDVVAAARAAARQASDRGEPIRTRRDALAGSVIAPPLEAEPDRRFTLSLPKRKKKEQGVTLRTMVVASGTAAALAITAAGASLYLASEGGGGEHIDRSSPPPTAARADDKKLQTAEATPATTSAPDATGTPGPGAADTLAVALAPAPGETSGLRPPAAQAAKAKPLTAASPPAPASVTHAPAVDAQALYNTAVNRLQSGDTGAIEDLKKAANLGLAQAQYDLSKRYEDGAPGLPKDLTEARRWSERAAQNGHAAAMYNYALYEFHGEGGPQDQVDSARWFRKAAEMGKTDSQYNLAMLYDHGFGVPQNKAEAYKWYRIAAAQGDKGAEGAAEALKAQLPAEQVQAADRTAQAFHAQHLPTVEQAKTN